MSATPNFECARCRGGPTSNPPLFLAPLHGEKGGPLMCIPCRLQWDHENAKDLQRCSEWKRELHGAGGGFNAILGRKFTYLTLELLHDAIALTHPDRHPPERAEEAQRVTAELLELKPYTPPKPKPPPPPPPVTDNRPSASGISQKPLRIDYPCATCFLTVPYYYCDACRKKWDEIKQRERDHRKKVQKRYRERRKERRKLRLYRPCEAAGCDKHFWPRRKDSRYCSSKCRQRQHRARRGDLSPKTTCQEVGGSGGGSFTAP
jgi:hypothetical protein